MRARLKHAQAFDPTLMEKRRITQPSVYYWIPPIDEREVILKRYHSDSHCGVCTMKRSIVADRADWRRVSRIFIRVCNYCSQTRGNNVPDKSYRVIVPNRPGHYFYIDLSFMARDGNDIGLIVLVDHHTKYAWVEAIQSKKSKSVVIFVESVFKEIVLKTLGDNEVAMHEMNVRSDNGGEFVATAVSDVCKKYGIKKLNGSAYSPWVQGAVERLNQTLKQKLIARLYQHKTTRWTQFVRDVTDEYNHTTFNHTNDSNWGLETVLES